MGAHVAGSRSLYREPRVAVSASSCRALLGLDGRGRPSLHEPRSSTLRLGVGAVRRVLGSMPVLPQSAVAAGRVLIFFYSLLQFDTPAMRPQPRPFKCLPTDEMCQEESTHTPF